MQRYANPASGVRAYECTPSAINVEFADGAVYVYNHAVTGRAQVERMKRLAREGRGLATYISQHVGANYAAKFESVKDARASARGSSSRRPRLPGS